MMQMPGGAVKIRTQIPGQDISKALVQFPNQPVNPDAYNDSAFKEQQIDRISGASPNFNGEGLGSRATATEAGFIQDVGMGRFDLATMQFDELFKRDALTKMFRLYQSRLTEPEVLEVAGQFAAQGEIDFNDIQDDIDIYVDSGKLGSLDGQKLQRLIEFYQVLFQNPDTAVWIDPVKFVDRLSYRIGIEDGDAILRTQEEVNEIMEAQQQQQLLAAALGGQGEGGVQ